MVNASVHSLEHRYIAYDFREVRLTKVAKFEFSARGRQTRLKCYQTSHCADSGSVCKFLADLPVEEDDAQLDYDTDVSQFGPVEMNDTETTTTSVNTTTVAPDTSTTEDTSSSDDVETTAVEEATERPDFTLEITDENGNPIDLFEPVSPIIVKDPGTTSSPTTELSGVDDRTDGPRAGSRNTPSEAKRSSAGYCVCDERERYVSDSCPVHQLCMLDMMEPGGYMHGF